MQPVDDQMFVDIGLEHLPDAPPQFGSRPGSLPQGHLDHPQRLAVKPDKKQPLRVKQAGL